jgi:hypothetical protein
MDKIMSENTIRVVRHQDFKKTIETVLGHSIRQEDVAVVSFDDKPLAERVAAIDLKEFIFKMVTFNKENNITSKDIAVITQEDLANEEKSIPENNIVNKNKFGKK